MFCAHDDRAPPSKYASRLDWQTNLSALAGIKCFRASANRISRGHHADTRSRFKATRSDPAAMPTESKARLEMGRAAQLGSTGGPDRHCSIVSHDNEHITVSLCDANGNAWPLCRDDAGALCGKSCTTCMRLPTSEPPTARVRARTNPNPSKPIQRVPVPPAV
jgi:hypothetical protein